MFLNNKNLKFYFAFSIFFINNRTIVLIPFYESKIIITILKKLIKQYINIHCIKNKELKNTDKSLNKIMKSIIKIRIINHKTLSLKIKSIYYHKRIQVNKSIYPNIKMKKYIIDIKHNHEKMNKISINVFV